MNQVFTLIREKIIKKEKQLTDRAIHYRIKTFQKKSNITIRRLAVNAYAHQLGIDLEKIVTSEELKELQDWLSKKPPVTSKISETKPKTKLVLSKPRKKTVTGFGLPANIFAEANRMSDIYPELYYLENLIRYVVMSTLEKKHGSNWWENRSVVSKKIAESVENRKHFERENRWVAKRGKHDIFYTDFGDLARIIAQNSNEFKPIFAGVEIEAELRKLEPLRNIVAHNNPLPDNDIRRIKTALDDVIAQLKK